MNSMTLTPCFSDHLTFVFDFRQVPCRYFLEFFQLFFQCCLCVWYFHCLGHWNKFVHKIAVTQWIHEFSCNVIVTISARSSSFHSDSHRFVRFDNTSVFFLCPSMARQVSLLLWHIGVLHGIAAGIGIPNFLRAFLIISLNSSPSRSRK